MSKTAKIISGIVAVVVIILIVVSGGNKNETGPIKIGFIGPLVGNVSDLGQASKASVEIAVDEINKLDGINGRQIEVVYEDGKCSPGPALSAAQKLINVDKVTAIIGGLCSGETSSFVTQTSEAKIPVISYCSSAPALSSSGPYFFRTYPSDSYQGKFAAEYAFNTLKAKNIAVLYTISDWGNGITDVFTKRFTELGGRIVESEGVNQEARDFKTQIAKIKAENPDYIYMPMYTDGSLIAVQQLQDLAVKTKILGADAWSDPKLIANVNKKADILYIGSTGNSSDVFKEKFIARTNSKEVPICAPQAYDAMYALTSALEQVGTDSDKLPEAIRSQKFDGVTGPVSFDTNGDIDHVEYVVKRIANGVVTEVK